MALCGTTWCSSALIKNLGVQSLGERLAEFPIVGIGSSAGGLEALEKLFDAMPPDTGAAFVVVAHLDPTRESHLSELLSRRTRMPTVAVEGATRIEPNHVYVIAPDQALMLDGGVLHPSKPKEPRAQRRPVDVFFRSLAENQKERAIAIVLSGTGTNGAAGLRFIKSEGGIVMAQEPSTAAHAGMPQSAIATGLVDLVLPPERMAEALVNVVRHPYVRQPDAAEPPELDGQLSALLALLRTRANLDFRPYRQRSLLRRIHRRMGLHQIQDADAYLERVRRDPDEVAALARDLTISVSGFFRDPEAWRILDEKVIAPLVAERDPSAAIRIWVPGCATGEEAYSLAILVLARAEQARKAFDLRIFATDVAQHILPTARAGLYPASIAPEIGAARLERFFDPVDDSYQAKKVLRDAITFAPGSAVLAPRSDQLPQSADLSRSGSAAQSGGAVPFRVARGWAPVSRFGRERLRPREPVPANIQEVANFSPSGADASRSRSFSPNRRRRAQRRIGAFG